MIFFSDSTEKLDANNILTKHGGNELRKVVTEIWARNSSNFEKSLREADKDLLGEDIQTFFGESFQSYIEENQKFADRKTVFFNLDAQIYNLKPGTYVLRRCSCRWQNYFCLATALSNGAEQRNLHFL